MKIRNERIRFTALISR